MRIFRLTVRNFRGFDEIEIVPRGHVLLVGEPRAGRSDLLAALGLAVATDPPRALSEFDFHEANRAESISVEVTIGDLEKPLQQRFLDELEFWSPGAGGLVGDLSDPAELPTDAVPILRLGFSGRWDAEEEAVEQIRYWVKSSDPSSDSFRRVSRADRYQLPILVVSAGRPLNLAPQGGLRSLLNEDDPDALAAVMDATLRKIEDLSVDLSSSEVVEHGLEGVLDPLRPYLGTAASIDELLRFLPEGGSLAGLLRALSPALDLDDGAGYLPLARHGSTTTAQVTAAEAVARATRHGAVVLIDDFGDQLDAASAERMSALLRRTCGQVWLSTRRAEMAKSFEADELIRLVRSRDGGPPTRVACYGSAPTTRSERIAAREIHLEILPSMTARALIVCEGAHDLSAYTTLAELLDRDQGDLPPTAFGIRLISAGLRDGGIDKVARVARLARSLGFVVVALIDFDNDVAVAASRLSEIQSAADAVVRLPPKCAVEEALLSDLGDEDIVHALQVLASEYNMPLASGWEQKTGSDLHAAAAKLMKSNNGLHSQFLRALDGCLPNLGAQALNAAIECANGVRSDAHVQL